MRTTHALVQLAIAFMAQPDAQHWGYQLSNATGIVPGALYSRLAAMLDEGWLTDQREIRDTIIGGRPPRRYFTLTPAGRSALTALLAKAAEDPRFRHLNFETRA